MSAGQSAGSAMRQMQRQMAPRPWRNILKEKAMKLRTTQPPKPVNKRWRIVRGDTVVVIAGHETSRSGKVLRVDRKKNRVYVQGVNYIAKHVRPKGNEPGGIVRQEQAIHYSNVQLVCPETKQARPWEIRPASAVRSQAGNTTAAFLFEPPEPNLRSMATRVRYSKDEAGNKIRIASVSGATIPWPEDHGKRRKPRRGPGASDTAPEEVTKVTFPGIEEEYLAWKRRQLQMREKALGAKKATPYTGIVPMETLLREPFRNLLATPGSVANGELAVKIGSINDPKDESVYAEELAEQRQRLEDYDAVMKAKVILAGKEDAVELAKPFEYDPTRQGRFKRAVLAGTRQREPMPTLVPDSPLAIGARARAGDATEEEMELVRESLTRADVEETLGEEAVGERSQRQRLRDGDDDVTFATIAQDETARAEEKKAWAREVLAKDRERRWREKRAGEAEEGDGQGEEGRQ